MKHWLFAMVLGAAVAVSGQAWAETLGDRLLTELRREGFTDIRIGRTLLGRTRIVARNGDVSREIVFNPATGVILRDYVRGWTRGDAEGPRGGAEGGAGNGTEEPDDDNGGDDDDNGGDDDDDDDDDGDDDDGNDNGGGDNGGGDNGGGDNGGDD